MRMRGRRAGVRRRAMQRDAPAQGEQGLRLGSELRAIPREGEARPESATREWKAKGHGCRRGRGPPQCEPPRRPRRARGWLAGRGWPQGRARGIQSKEESAGAAGGDGSSRSLRVGGGTGREGRGRGDGSRDGNNHAHFGRSLGRAWDLEKGEEVFRADGRARVIRDDGGGRGFLGTARGVLDVGFRCGRRWERRCFRDGKNHIGGGRVERRAARGRRRCAGGQPGREVGRRRVFLKAQRGRPEREEIGSGSCRRGSTELTRAARTPRGVGVGCIQYREEEQCHVVQYSERLPRQRPWFALVHFVVKGGPWLWRVLISAQGMNRRAAGVS